MEIKFSVCFFLAFLLHLSTLSFINAEATDISTDKQALLALKAGISHDPSNLLAGNWSTRASVCDWIGITCGVRHHRVTALNISYLNLTATLPPQLGNLSFLVILSIRNNSFHGSIPDELAHLRRLRYLQFSFNNFINLKIPSWLGSLTKLQFLGLSEVKFSGTIPRSLGNLSSLERLHLDHNQLSGSIPTSIFNISSLQKLSLYQNQLSGSFPSILSNMTSLIYIDLGDNGLSGGLSATTFDHLPNLESLYLDKNLFNGEIPSSLPKCKGLQYLTLAINYFIGSIPREIGNLTQLKWLYLGYNEFQGMIHTNIYIYIYITNFLSRSYNCLL
ncbi:LRR receptor-like serine/threonine-protein kinase EFR [Mangifera indica]|uniref:LRR receptor-like serine/threonine-protein kinase EFR n=1 Tax=Mangifera indica TaxID=29780 RepID=UPI001CFB7A1C|nr:LRR receptor-like serine/threonine-protein kinase EFR [Mangifera indica]